MSENAEDSGQTSRIYVGNLPMEADQVEMREKFKKYGVITNITVLKGFGFVQFSQEESAKAAIQAENGSEFFQKLIDVKPAVRKLSAPKDQSQPQNDNFHQSGSLEDSKQGGNPSQNQGNKISNPIQDFPENKNARQHQGGGYHRQDFPERENSRYRGGGYSNQDFLDSENLSHQERYPRQHHQAVDNSQDFRRGGNHDHFQGGSKPGRYQRGGRGGYHHPYAPRGGFQGSGGYHGSHHNTTRYDGGGYPSGPEQSYHHQQQQQQQQRDEPERKKPCDCEIVCVNKAQRNYAEMVESRLKNLGMDLDILFPNPEIPLSKILNNITGRGVMYAILVTPMHEEHNSITVNILHGQQQEHRNMPLDDAINLMAKDFQKQLEIVAHNSNVIPRDIVTILGFLSDNRPLSVMELDKLIKYLAQKRTHMLKMEYGENIPAHLISAPVGPAVDPSIKAKEEEIKVKVLSILNEPRNPPPIQPQQPQPSQLQPTPGSSGSSAFIPQPAAPANPINATLQNAIESLIKSGPNLLKQQQQQQQQQQHHHHQQQKNIGGFGSLLSAPPPPPPSDPSPMYGSGYSGY